MKGPALKAIPLEGRFCDENGTLYRVRYVPKSEAGPGFRLIERWEGAVWFFSGLHGAAGELYEYVEKCGSCGGKGSVEVSWGRGTWEGICVACDGTGVADDA